MRKMDSFSVLVLVECIVIWQHGHVSAAPPSSTKPVPPSPDADAPPQASGGSVEEQKSSSADNEGRPDPPSPGGATDSVRRRLPTTQERSQAMLPVNPNVSLNTGLAAASGIASVVSQAHESSGPSAVGLMSDTAYFGLPVLGSSSENAAQTVHEQCSISENEENLLLEGLDQHEEPGTVVGNMEGASSIVVNVDHVLNVEEPLPAASFDTNTEEIEGPEAGLLPPSFDKATWGTEGPEAGLQPNSFGMATAEVEDPEAGLLDTAAGGADPEVYFNQTKHPWPPDLDDHYSDIEQGYQIDRDLHGSDHRLQYNPDLMIGTRSGISACPAPNFEQYLGDHYIDLAVGRRREAACLNRTQRPWNIQPVDQSEGSFAGTRHFHDSDLWRCTPRQWNEQPHTGRENETESPNQTCLGTGLQSSPASHNALYAALVRMLMTWQQGQLPTSLTQEMHMHRTSTLHVFWKFLVIITAVCLLHLFASFFLILASFLISFIYHLRFLLGL